MQRTIELGRPGPMRDRLVAAALSGAKTASSTLRAQYQDDGQEPPVVGDRLALVDSSGKPAATVEVTAVTLMRLGDADEQLAEDEGAGFRSAAEWRERHEAFWTASTLPSLKRVPTPVLDDDAEVVVVRFHVVS